MLRLALLGSRKQLRCDQRGGLAQLGEHLLCKQGVVGSIPSSSTNDAGGQCAGTRNQASR